jgi:hypothetical protein
MATWRQVVPKDSTAPKLVFFQEILEGDLKKQKAESNEADTGGGARDMRIPKTFETFLLPFFPAAGNSERVNIGTVTWHDGARERNTTLELWRPTKARPAELRIARIHQVDAWKITDEEAFVEDLSAGKRWFYLLVMTEGGKVVASIMQAAHLDDAEARIKRAIWERVRATASGRASRGIYDYNSGSVHP